MTSEVRPPRQDTWAARTYSVDEPDFRQDSDARNLVMIFSEVCG